MNMRNKRFIKYVHKSHFLEELPSYKGVEATFRVLGMEPNIKYIDMPENLRGKYQYYTQAEMGKLYNTGYPMPFLDVAHGVTDYVQNHLAKDYLTY